MMNKNEFTKVTALASALTILNSLDTVVDGVLLVGNEEINVDALVEKLEGMKSVLENRTSSTSSKVSAAKVAELEQFTAEVQEVLSGSNGMTISEMQKASAFLADFSNQKVSAMLKKMCDAGKVVKTKDKKTTVFALAENEG